MNSPRCVFVGRLAVLVIVVLSLPRLVEAQATSASKAPAAEQKDYQILTYDVADLLLDVPDYPYPTTDRPSMPGRGDGMMGGMGGGMFNVAPEGSNTGAGSPGGTLPTATFVSSRNVGRITIVEIVDMLTTVVAPDTWSLRGGTVVSLGTSLVIRQTPSAHQEIGDLLGQLRKQSHKRNTVVVDARWLLLNSDELDRLAPPATSGGASVVDRAVLEEYTRRPSTIRGRTHCFTGQLVYLISGTRKNTVSSFIPVVGSVDRPEDRSRQYASHGGGARVFLASYNGLGDERPKDARLELASAVGYQPVIERTNFGVLLQIRPTLLSRDETAMVDLRSTLTVPDRDASDARAKSPPNPLAPSVDRLAVQTQELATTLTVSLGKPVIVGGMTYLGPPTPGGEKSKPDAPNAKEVPQLYLVLELR